MAVECEGSIGMPGYFDAQGADGVQRGQGVTALQEVRDPAGSIGQGAQEGSAVGDGLVAGHSAPAS